MVPALTYRPFTGIRRVWDYDPVESFFDRVLGDLDSDVDTWQGGSYPVVDIYHDDALFIVRAELPGLELKDVSLKVQGSHLVLEGEKRHADGKSYHRVESWCGKFCRFIPLPSTVDTEKIDAKFVHGVLTVTLPILATVKPKEIPVKLG
ncbi:MAG: Hsp20/alpha crystallin family protein [Planctomycetes bacterium]|nr:Hsp20/alpha crystallin family protein [Planctomycetota bacterium]